MRVNHKRVRRLYREEGLNLRISALGDRTPNEFARLAGVNPGQPGASEVGKLT
jgi:hypothetical protein